MNRPFGLLLLLALLTISRTGAAQGPSTRGSASDSVQDRLLRRALDVPGATLEYRWATAGEQKTGQLSPTGVRFQQQDLVRLGSRDLVHAQRCPRRRSVLLIWARHCPLESEARHCQATQSGFRSPHASLSDGVHQ